METFWVYSRIPYLRGRSMARKDLAQGKIVLLTFGPPARWRSIYAEILKRDYGIALEAVADNAITPLLREKVRGYNSISKELILTKHGKDFLEMVIEQAKEILLLQDKKTELPPSA